MTDTIPFYIEQVLGFLASPWSIVLLIVGMGLVFVVTNVPSAKWWAISVLLYSTTFGVTNLEMTTNAFAVGSAGVQHLAFPLNVVQNNARMLTILCLVFMIFPTMTAARGRRLSFVTGAFVGFFLLEMWVCLRLALDLAAVPRAALDFVVAILMLVTLVIGVGRWLQTPADARALIKAMVGFGILFILGNIYQIILVPSTASQPRLAGTTPSAQSVGQIAALIIIPSLFLAQDKLVSRGWRTTSLAVAGTTGMLLLWSGSRTGMMMTASGFLVLYGARLHRFIIPAVGLLLVMWAGSMVFPMAFAGIARFTDTTNDRAGAWSWMTQVFMMNPVIGITSNGMGYRESFFLATLAYYGAVGAMPVLLMIALAAGAMAKLLRNRVVLGVNAPLTRFLLAMFAMLTVGAIFEASLLGLLNAVTMILYMMFAMLAFCRDDVALNRHAPALDADPYAASPYGTPAYGVPPAGDLSWY